jgi:hypothetical protein
LFSAVVGGVDEVDELVHVVLAAELDLHGWQASAGVPGPANGSR